MSRHPLPILTLLIACAALGIHVIPGAAAALQLDRAAVGDGEFWRILTCHLTHVDVSHLVWNVVVFVALGWRLERRDPGRFRFVLGVAILAIPPAIILLLPDLDLYRGLSGLDSALFAMLAVDLIRSGLKRRRPGAVVLPALLVLAFIAKIAWEAHAGTTVFVDSGAAALIPVPLAHLVGAAAGMAGA